MSSFVSFFGVPAVFALCVYVVLVFCVCAERLVVEARLLDDVLYVLVGSLRVIIDLMFLMKDILDVICCLSVVTGGWWLFRISFDSGRWRTLCNLRTTQASAELGLRESASEFCLFEEICCFRVGDALPRFSFFCDFGL